VDVSHVPLELGEVPDVSIEAAPLLPEAGPAIIARNPGKHRGVEVAASV
jgi:hypothetical protein